jgi:hypothetical protein
MAEKFEMILFAEMELVRRIVKMSRLAVHKITDVSAGIIASIFTVEE